MAIRIRLASELLIFTDSPLLVADVKPCGDKEIPVFLRLTWVDLGEH